MLSVRFMLLGLVLVLLENFGSCNLLRETVSDDIDKRSVSVPHNGITLNFQHGMRDFIVNGKGLGVHQQTLVAFQTTLTSGNLGPNYALGVIKFNDVSVNIGNGYDSSTGKFTAPVKGLYQFTATYLQQNGYTSHVRMMKDNTVISDIHANHKSYDQLTKTILVVLEKGNTFWVKLQKSSIYAVHGSSRYTQFGGFLLSVI